MNAMWFHSTPRAGDIGPNRKEIELEPLTEPASPEPITTPAPAPEPAKQPEPVPS